MTAIETPHDTTTSPDGTTIAYERRGAGRGLVLVHGGTADRSRWRTVAHLLEPHATVYAMDRRGRGGSGDAAQYAVGREYDDVAAVVRAAGDGADLLGHSFGGLCALEASLRAPGLRRLVLYEPPVVDDILPPGLLARLERLLAEGEREEMLATFFREAVEMPEDELTMYRALPAWQARIAAAHTLARELRVVNRYRFDPRRFAAMTVPTLLLLGGDSPASMRASTWAVAEALPDSRVVVLEGQQHIAMDTAPGAFADAVVSFLREA